MNSKHFSKIVVFAAFLLTAPLLHAAAPTGPQWKPWSDQIFEQAQRENRNVLLDLEAVWCHWCHVMDQETYSDPRVLRLIEEKFIPVKVDQDSNPGLANRYQQYGWPATIVFDAEGNELVKKRGYIEVEEMLQILSNPKILQNVSDQRPTEPPSPDSSDSNELDETLKLALENRYRDAWDEAEGGLALRLKFLDGDTLEYALLRAREGGAEDAQKARRYLDVAQALFDPAWGGVYQYSAGGVWTRPHFEKILSFQVDNLRTYAQAFAQFQDPQYLRQALEVHRYLDAFLKSPEGVFYASQDADLHPGEHGGDYFQGNDAERRAQGIPRIDRHLYARENGWVIAALVDLHQATGEAKYLEEAEKTAKWILARRSIDRNPWQAIQYVRVHGKSPVGGFWHEQAEVSAPYLGDTLAMSRAFLALYQASADRFWLQKAETGLRFIQENFRDSNAGFTTALPRGKLGPTVDLKENIQLARLANLAFHYTGDPLYRGMARHALRYFRQHGVALGNFTEPGILLAARELNQDPLHLTIIGKKSDAGARALQRAALRYPETYKRIDWWDGKTEAPPNTKVGYPNLGRAAAFICNGNSCSAPIFDARQLDDTIRNLGKIQEARNAEKNVH